MQDLYAATPPLELFRFLLSLCCTRRAKSGARMKARFIDVKRAFLVTPATEDVFIELPTEDPSEPGKDQVGKLKKSMYGTRSAAKNWQSEIARVMRLMGYDRARSTPTLYRKSAHDVTVVVHGDDFWAVGPQEALDTLVKEISAHWTVETKATLGPEEDDDKRVTSLNRIIRWTEKGIEIEADPRHAQLIVAECGMINAKAVATPGVKDPAERSGLGQDEEVNGDEKRAYRSVVARANYLAQDRVEIKFAAKELARTVSAPTRADVQALKRLARYLKGQPRQVTVYEWQGELAGEMNPKKVRSLSDSNWADCRSTRRSTSGGALVHGKHCLTT